jgi:hypothetical protein
MNAERLERLKKRYDYDRWPQGNEGPGTSEPRPVPPAEEMLPDWRLDHVDRLQEEGMPPRSHALWTRGGDVALAVEIWDCASPAAARELLLALLDQFESTLVERVTGPGSVGDVAFAHGEHMLLFARGHRVVRIRNAGRELVLVAGPAREIDALLTGTQER